MFLERGFEFTHGAVRDWEARLPRCWQTNCAPRDVDKEARSWYVDETHINVKGKWRYLSRAIDRDGNLVDSMPSREA